METFFRAVKKSKKVKSMKTADGFTKTFPQWPRSLMEGMELKLCFVTSCRLDVLTIVRESFVGKVFGAKYKPFTSETAGEFARCSESIIRLFFVVCLSNCRVATFHRESRNHRYRVVSFFNASQRGLKESPNKLLTVRFCSKLSLVKSSAQKRECFEGTKHSLFISVSHSLLSFGSWVSLKVLTLDFELFV